MDIDITLYMLQQQLQKYVLLVAIARHVTIIYTISYLHVFKARYFFSKHCHSL